MDGNFIGHQGTIRPEHFAERAAWDYRLNDLSFPIVMTHQPNFFDYRAPEADLLVYPNRCTTHIETSRWKAKGLYWPGVPLPSDLFRTAYHPDHKSADVGLIGTLNRGAKCFRNILKPQASMVITACTIAKIMSVD